MSPVRRSATLWRHRFRLPSFAALTISAAALAFGCGGADGSTPTSTATAPPTASASPAGNPGIDYPSLSGEIRVDGSSTVFPITEAVAEEFSAVAARVRTNVAFSGTGGGFEKFCRGEIEVADASRPIKDEELATCAAAGIDDVIELRVATDALAVMVNPANDFVSDL